MDEPEIRELFAPLEGLVPAAIIVEGRELDESEVVQYLFGFDAGSPDWRILGGHDDFNRSTGQLHWFVTRVRLSVTTDWLGNRELRRLAEQLRRWSIRTRVEHVTRSRLQEGQPSTLVLELEVTRRAGKRPPQRTSSSRGTALPAKSVTTLGCSHCGAKHRLTTSAKANMHDSGDFDTDYCLRCGREVFSIFSYRGYLLEWLVDNGGSPYR